MKINIEISEDEFDDAFNWFFVPYRLLWTNYFDYLNEKVDSRNDEFNFVEELSRNIKVDMDLLNECKGE